MIITALNAELEMIQAAIKVEHEKLTDILSTTIEEHITSRHKATCTRKQLREGMRDDIEITFDIGFWNEEEQRIDFGSDCWLTFESSNGKLAVNTGTIGNYTKDNIYQVKRVMLVADIFSRIDEIEAALEDICKASQNYKKLCADRSQIEYKIMIAQREARTKKLSEIEANLSEGDIVKYDDTVRVHDMLFNTRVGFWSIAKISNKTIKVAQAGGQVKQIPKEKFISLIEQGKILVNNKKEN